MPALAGRFMKAKKFFVLGLDGIPYSFLMKKFSEGKMPQLGKICNLGRVKSLESVYPPVSSVAWTSFATGKNPACHNIFGFADRIPNPFSIYIPTSNDRRLETVWSKLSGMGKKVIVINVPLTYPPERVNGIMVSCFLSPGIKKAIYPEEFASFLTDRGYIIDTDAHVAKHDKGRFLNELILALEKRFEISFELMEKEEWDFFQLHIMETDRLFHFLWDDAVPGTGGCHTGTVNEFFRKLDYYIGKLFMKLPPDTKFITLSDHGFCKIKYEVRMNKWLEREGLLKLEQGNQLLSYNRDSICYSLVPGRMFMNLEGREEKGFVKQHEYSSIRRMIKDRLLSMRDPEGNRVISKVFFREDIYEGPFLNNAADIIVHPVDGYDLKGQGNSDEIFTRTHLSGMHTFDDAMIAGVNTDISSAKSITDVSEIIINEVCYDRT